MRTNPYSLPDPGQIFVQRDTGPLAGIMNTIYNDTTAKTIRALSVNPAQKTLFLISAGQSNATNICPTKYTPANPTKIDNFNPFTGLNYAATDVLLGVSTTDTGTFCANHILRVADNLVTSAKFDRVVIAPVAVSGTNIIHWSPESDALGLYRTIQSTYLKVLAQGFSVNTAGLFFAVLWNQGESDQRDGTTQLAYTNSFNAMKGAIQSYIPNCKIIVSRETWFVGAVSTAVQNAQAAVVDNVTVFAGGNLDSITATGRQADNTHFNDTGAATAASLSASAIQAITF